MSRKKCPPGCTCGRHTHVLRTSHNKVCEECGAPFIAKRIDARFCSGDCNLKSYQRRNRDKIRERGARWQRDNREKRRATVQRHEEKHGERVRAEKRQRYAEETADPVKAAAKRERSRQYYQENRDAILARARSQQEQKRAARTRSAHGTEWDALFDKFWEAQDGQCYLCGDPLDREAYRAIHLDHDHRCCPLGKSCERCRRGLACKECNLLIGHANDDPARLRRIAGNLDKAIQEVTQRMQQPRQRRQPLTHELACQECGNLFAASRSDALCCSTRCYNLRRSRQRQLAWDEEAAVIICQQCGGEFKTVKPSVAKYCSKLCSNRAYVQRRNGAGGQSSLFS